MNPFSLLFNGSVCQAKVIGEDPEYQALRRRTERRIAALKADNRLYEVKCEPAATYHQSSARNLTPAERERLASAQHAATCNAAAQLAQYGYSPGSALANIIGVSGSYFGSDN